MLHVPLPAPTGVNARLPAAALRPGWLVKSQALPPNPSPHARRITGMSAFGRRNGGGAQTPGRPSFGIARPMQGGGILRPDGDGGDQFPPIDAASLGAEAEAGITGTMPGVQMDAMQRLADRQNASGDAGSSRAEGFEASVHKIKEQVLPRLLERVDPEAAATLGKDELAEEFRPIIGEVLAELKLDSQPPRAVRARKGAGRRAAGLGAAGGAARRSDDHRHHGQRPRADLHRAEGQARHRADPVPRRGASVPDRAADRATRSAAASTRRRRSPTPA